ncbi:MULTISPECIES: hypothetical protein [unclassified Flavonifractor]|uniref:hypothetical protein n=1 Tax=Flavonifractor sp. An92 TaxID=1965666 RepID=UPI001120C5F7|nr:MULTISPECIES: hypothetical protein [unclassified Flavonifractor]
MISNEEKAFLRWLSKQPDPVSHSTMSDLSAPEYSSHRVDSLYKGGYLSRSLSVENGEITGLYTVSDKARATLQESTKLSHEKIAEWVRYIITTAIAVIALIRTFL